jgi:hypothetical protein
MVVSDDAGQAVATMLEKEFHGIDWRALFANIIPMREEAIKKHKAMMAEKETENAMSTESKTISESFNQGE